MLRSGLLAVLLLAVLLPATADGHAALIYTGAHEGDDTIIACLDSDGDGDCDATRTATKSWTVPEKLTLEAPANPWTVMRTLGVTAVVTSTPAEASRHYMIKTGSVRLQVSRDPRARLPRHRLVPWID